MARVITYRKEKVPGSKTFDHKGWVITELADVTGRGVGLNLPDAEFKALLKAMKKAYKKGKKF